MTVCPGAWQRRSLHPRGEKIRAGSDPGGRTRTVIGVKIRTPHRATPRRCHGASHSSQHSRAFDLTGEKPTCEYYLQTLRMLLREGKEYTKGRLQVVARMRSMVRLPTPAPETLVSKPEMTIKLNDTARR